MADLPAPPGAPSPIRVYHIAHIDKLPFILADGHLLPDAVIAKRPTAGTTIGMSEIKARRFRLPVTCHPPDVVADYVPFYFCPRSVMLYLIYRRNSQLEYQGGQEPIVHLEYELHDVIAWANGIGRRWAFTTSNAGAYYAEFYADAAKLGRIKWSAVVAREWSPPAIKEGKQAEFLVRDSVPWNLVRRVGVQNAVIGQRVHQLLTPVPHRPTVQLLPGWYY